MLKYSVHTRCFTKCLNEERMSMRDFWIPTHSNKTHNYNNTQKWEDKPQIGEEFRYLERFGKMGFLKANEGNWWNFFWWN